MTTISAKTILRSRNVEARDKILSTLLLRYPRWIHAEGRTHRKLDIGENMTVEIRTPSVMECDELARNAGSSRAIPVEKLIQDVVDDTAMPLFWGKNVAGMQAHEELGPFELAEAKKQWLAARDSAIIHARAMSQLGKDSATGKIIGAHKQIVNRLLEPFSHITVLVSATEWNNFFALRDHADAEPHIGMLARAIRAELNQTKNIQLLEPDQWHLPFIEAQDYAEVVDFLRNRKKIMPTEERMLKAFLNLSLARCASTSYKTVDGFDMSFERAEALCGKLLSSTPLHASPAEHIAQADGYRFVGNYMMGWKHPAQHGNLVGFRQYRKMLPNEFVPG